MVSSLQSRSQKSQGFTLIELVLVVVILGVLAVVAAPRFIDLSGDARAQVIESLTGTFISQEKMLFAMAQIPGNQLSSGGSQVWLDMNNNGVIDGDDAGASQSSIVGRDGVDIFLLSTLKVDNYQVHKLVDLPDEIVVQLGPNNHQAYIGYDFDGDGDVREHNCRVYYDQNSFRNRVDGC